MRNLFVPLLAVVASILSSVTAYADLGDQLYKLLPDDGAADDLFGYSVSIRGDIAIIGAPRDSNKNGPFAGSAYLFNTTTGEQIASLRAIDGSHGNELGWSVAISETIAIAGAQRDSDNGIHAGAVYVFDITNGNQIAQLLADDGTTGDWFGRSVAISGPTGNEVVIVGASGDGINGAGSGSAYLFDFSDPGNPVQIAKLLPKDGDTYDWFGSSVAIVGNAENGIALVGALGNDDNGEATGSAYLFDTSTGMQTYKILPNDSALGDKFGAFVGIVGTTAVITAWGNDDNGPNSGSVYLFDITTGQQLSKILSDDGAEDDYFGASVAISGAPGNEIAIIGTAGDDENGNDSGSAYLFDVSDPTNPTQIAKILPDDGAEGDWFGQSVAINGDIAVVGAHWDDDNGFKSGSAYLFEAGDILNCPWDLHGDGIVGGGDLLILLGWWGFDPEGPPDFDGDGNVSTIDLLELLVHWGPCG